MIGIKIPWQVFACTGLVIILGLFSYKMYDLGRDHNEEKWQGRVERGKKIVEQLKAGQGKITVKTEVRYVERVKIIKEKARVIEKKIPIYIPVDTPDLPGGFRVFHDSSTFGTLPGAAEDGLPVPVRTVAETISRNYAVCHQWKEALDAHVQWAQEQRKVYLSECKRLKQKCS